MYTTATTNGTTQTVQAHGSGACNWVHVYMATHTHPRKLEGMHSCHRGANYLTAAETKDAARLVEVLLMARSREPSVRRPGEPIHRRVITYYDYHNYQLC
eukprot:SAG31_NODE_27_length_32731_cov_1443.130393_17_plen_100_part_00